ncbi:fasciclin domain family protein [Colletotrichum tofieldiae]|uniref:Fasciclin domain family protein n=1 Tax=Colletotrichum tofieldiae TaxID=708197 RepID=A0A166T1T8_9PEZI|nr:fasciclin domain family protein [Colletotrichum tofieldiae]
MVSASVGEVFPGSQASSHFMLEPISAAVLCSRETKRRDAVKSRGPLRVGCREVDEEVLVGGFERGSVVGISAESEQMGLLALVNTLCEHSGGGAAKGKARAMVITTQPPATILPTLRDAIRGELKARETAEAEMTSKLRGCLERVSVSRVFDLEGLWEVLGDLDFPPESAASKTSPAPKQHQQHQQGEGETGEALQVPEPSPELPRQLTPEEQCERIVLPELKPPKPTRMEIADSDEEDALSSSSELSPPPSSIRSPTPYMAADPPEKLGSQERLHEEIQDQTPDETREEIQQEQREQLKGTTPEEEPSEPGPPDIILITHFHSLMSALFTRRDRQSAHKSLQFLSSHLRYLARNLPRSPLVMLLNSTSSSKETSTPKPEKHQDGPPQPMPPPPPNYGRSTSGSSNKPLDPTLRSIFNPPPLNFAGYGSNQAASRRNKPTFGLVFSQLLDLHLLCTRVPRDKEDAEKSYAPVPGPGVGGRDEVRFTGAVRYVWVIEVLLDELGVWEGGSSGVRKVRKNREQRWAAVDVRGGRVVDAFEVAERRVGEVRVVGGFGGPRV